MKIESTQMGKMVVLTFLVSVCLGGRLHAFGSGGILNYIPQAHVWITEGGVEKEVKIWKVYVHPMEGSFLLIPKNGEECLALDKNKFYAAKLKKSAIKISDTGRIIDVPEKVEYSILKHRPHFNRTFVMQTLDDGRVLTIRVDR